MSYLDVPRLHFTGSFYTDPSTMDNDPVHYNVDCVNPSPWQKPDGNHYFQLVNCTIRSALDQTGAYSSDALVIGAEVQSTDQPAKAKLADLDVYQQGVSTIFGLNFKLALTDGTSLVAPMDPAVLNSAAFNVVLPQRSWQEYSSDGSGSYGGDSNARGVFQSILRVDPAQWPQSASPLLQQLRAAAAVVDGKILLSLKITLDGYINNPDNPKVCTGRIVGCLGPQKANEPLYCLGQRWLSAIPSPDSVKPPSAMPAWNVPAFYDAPFKVDETRSVLVVDLANSIATASIGGPPVDVGTLSAVIIGPMMTIGGIEFSQFIYENSAGLCEWQLSAIELTSLKSNPLSLLTSRTDIPGGPYVLKEAANGFNLAVDDRIMRIPGEPGSTQSVRAIATQWGKPAVNVFLKVSVVPVHGDTYGATVPPTNPGDTPAADGAIAASITPTDVNGFATVTVTVLMDPESRTPLLDGQLYFIYPYADTLSLTPAQEYRISCLAWSQYTVNKNPTWDDIVAMLTVYVKLFPSMKEQVNLIDPTAFANYAASPPFGVPDPNNPGHLIPSGFYDVPADYKILDRITGGVIPFFVTRDQNDPRFMPVTRDLSPNKIMTMLYFIQNSFFPPTPPSGAGTGK